MESGERVTHFIQQIIEEDLASGKITELVTRFPPEPNGYLHVGHAKAICLNFSLATEYGGRCHLRFDDTNPLKEEALFAKAMQEDILWLGYEWDALTHASDYFERLYALACDLIRGGHAYVCSLTAEQVRESRGTLTTVGQASPDRDRSIKDNLELFQKMREGVFEEGQYTLRAKIDMSAGNMNMRDPAIYRIRHIAHPRTGETWSIYPLYDFTHPLSDALECITHSLCSLEFQDHRPLYDWFVSHCDVPGTPRQIEFSRLNISHTMTSKRKLKLLVDEGVVDGWDDPRMPTLCGLRRRGFPAEAIRSFCRVIGVTKQDSVIDMGVLEREVRQVHNEAAPRFMGVLSPIRVVIENMPEDFEETMTVPVHPQQPEQGTRDTVLTREIWIDADDFALEPPPKYRRLSEGRRVRLRYAYVIHCHQVLLNTDGSVRELRCTYDPDTGGGQNPADGKKIKGIIHWVSVAHAKRATVRLYDRLFTHEQPASLEDWREAINPDSLVTTDEAVIESDLAHVASETTVQLTRLGYFCADRYDHSAEHPVFNRVVTLRETWQAVVETESEKREV